MNGILCHIDKENKINFGQIVFDDRTALKFTRTFSPLIIKLTYDPINQISINQPVFKSKNNNFQDHSWDGF